ncbi:MAG: DUF3500 domain-containing protein [Planctomycetaceae bacterium]|nr:DUF3500 domain-containing protein [Planctomycetaceae bacterium]
MTQPTHRPCSDCDAPRSRRDFLRTAGGIALAGAAGSLLVPRAGLFAAPSPTSAAETAVGRFYTSLSAEQRAAICFPFSAPDRQKINANWHITKPVIGDDFYSAEQRATITEIVKGITSEDGYERLVKQMEYDDGGLNFYSVAVFGEPGNGQSEFELTGRHLTLRADGNTVDQAAFGGPIVYGHGEEDPAENLYHYQTKATDEVFRALSAAQAQQALIEKAPQESAVAIQGATGTFPGIAVSELTSDQRELVSNTLKTLLAPYRQEDIDEVMAILKASGGVESLHMAFYKQEDLKQDNVWDIWRIEGPSFVWHFRGAPHVHAYINIGGATRPA